MVNNGEKVDFLENLYISTYVENLTTNFSYFGRKVLV